MVVGTSADNVIQFIIFAILARILPVRDLGIVAFTMLFIDLSRVLVTGGLPQTMVQDRLWDDHRASVCFTYNAVMALIVAALFAGVGGPLMERYYGKGSGLVSATLGLVFFIDAIKGVHAAKLRRELRYRSLAVRGSVAGLIGGAIAIAMALMGAGVWSLVFQRLTNQAVTTWLTWRATKWRPAIRFDLQVLKQMMPFSMKVTVTRGLETLNLRLPDIIVGFIGGPIAVAIYRVGTRALETLRRIVIVPFQDASFAALSRLESDQSISWAYIRLSRAVATATFPVFLGSTAVAREITILLFGEKYAQSGAVFAILCLAGLPNTLTLFASSAFMASGRPRIGTVINSSLAVLNLVLITPLAYFFGSTGAASGSATATLMILPLVILLLKRSLGLRVRRLLMAIAPSAAIASAMAAALWLSKIFLLPTLPDALEVGVLIPLGGILYVALFATWGRTHLRELIADLLPILPAFIQRRLDRQRRA